MVIIILSIFLGLKNFMLKKQIFFFKSLKLLLIKNQFEKYVRARIQAI